MRLFIAVNINQRSKNLIEKRVKNLKSEINYELKWIKKENWHLTLKFIGEADSDDKNNIIQVLNKLNFKKAVNNYVQFSGIAAFPNLDELSVLYLPLRKGRDILEGLHDSLEKELAKFGFERDRRKYIPHLTLARNKGELFKLEEKFKKQHYLNIFAKIESISLFESKLKADGPEYIELFSIK